MPTSAYYQNCLQVQVQGVRNFKNWVNWEARNLNKFLNFVICSTIFIVSQSHTSRVMPGLRGDDDGVQ